MSSHLPFRSFARRTSRPGPLRTAREAMAIAERLAGSRSDAQRRRLLDELGELASR